MSNREWRETDFYHEYPDVLDGALTLRKGDEYGRFDELVANGVSVHIEMMDDDCMWLCIEKDGFQGRFTMLVISKADLNITATQEVYEPHLSSKGNKE